MSAAATKPPTLRLDQLASLADELLDRDEILGIDDILFQIVPVPEWGGKVIVRGMTGDERDAFEQSTMVEKRRGQREVDMSQFRAKLVAATVVNKRGERVFSQEHVERLGKKSAAALARVFDVGMELSGMSRQDVEELTGNSPEGQNGASTPDSPPISDDQA